MEEAIILILVALSLLTIFCLYKMLDKRGLYFCIVILSLISFVLSFKITNVFKMNVNINVVTMIATTTVMYIFMIKYGHKEIKNLLNVTLYSNVITALLLVIMNYFIPAITETISINMQGTFEYNYKILISFPIIMFLAQFAVAKLYKLVYSLQSNVLLCVGLSHIISSLLYTVLFCTASYINILETKYSLFVGISTYILGLPVLIINLIFINYLLKNAKVKS